MYLCDLASLHEILFNDFESSLVLEKNRIWHLSELKRKNLVHIPE